MNRVVIYHRIGRLEIGKSVFCCSGLSPSEAFEACRYAIDTLKHNAPIWKKKNTGRMVPVVGLALVLVKPRKRLRP